MIVYLAGKISPHNDWRFSIVPGIGNVDGASEWPVLKQAISSRHDYCGPYFSLCGHSLAAEDHGIEGDWKHCDDLLTHRIAIAQSCCAAILKCDFFFAWIESKDAFGTFAEIGYAAHAEKPIYISSPNEQWSEEMWFLESMADGWTECGSYWGAPSILDAFSEAVSWAEGRLFHKLTLCESPIERMFLQASPKWLVRDLQPQYSVGNYRLDFAIPEIRFCVELDGHDAHKSKEQRTHDASRDRWLELNGWRVVRFTGSEIFRDAKKCVDEATRFLSLSMRGAK